MAKESFNGQMELIFRAKVFKIRYLARAFTNGPTDVVIMVSGKEILCTEKELSHGQTIEGSLVNIKMKKSVAMANSFGLTDDAIKATGRTENKTELAV